MRKIIFLFLLITLTSCISIQTDNRDYKNNYTTEYETLFSKTKKVISPPNDSIYYINGTVIREDLKNHPKSMVYFFNPACRSKYCKLLTFYENYAEKNGYFLYLVAYTKQGIDNAINQLHTSQLYIMDFEHYGNINNHKTEKLFVRDLIENSDAKANGSFYFFKRDSFVKTLWNNEI